MPLIPSPHRKGSLEHKTCRGECGKDGHGLYDATTDRDKIMEWWRRCPDANVAIRTGAPAVDVLDVDMKPDKGINGYAAFNRLKRAGLLAGGMVIVHTPSGGLHVYYVGTDQQSGSLPKEGLDFKASGGYVLAPPSIVNGRRYELVEQREDGWRLDWHAAHIHLRPPRPRPALRVVRADTDPVPPWLETRLRDTSAPDRSAAFHGLVGSCHRAGLTLDRTISLLAPWCEATGKYVGRVEGEVTRSWRKVGGT